MPKFVIYYNQIMNQLNQAAQQTQINLLDRTILPEVFYEHATKTQPAKHRRREFNAIISRSLAGLSNPELEAFYDKLYIPEKGKKEFTKKEFVRKITTGEASNMLNPALWGRTQEEVLGAFDEVMEQHPAILENIQKTYGDLRLPGEEGYLPDMAKDYVFADKINQLKAKHTSPEDQRLLDEVNEQLAYTKENVRAYMNGFEPDVDRVMSRQPETGTMSGFQTYQNGLFNGYLAPDVDSTGEYRFATERSNARNRLKDEDKKYLSEQPTTLSKEALDQIQSVIDIMDQMDQIPAEIPLEDDQKLPFIKDQKNYIPGEQGAKLYAFATLRHAQVQLENAVNEAAEKGGSLDKVREASAAYKALNAQYDQMFSLLKESKVPLFASNVDSVRIGGQVLPPKYLTDYQNQNKLNSLHCLYSYARNTQVPVKDFLEKPYNAMDKVADQYLGANGLNSRQGIGASLAWGTAPVAGELESNFSTNMLQLERGVVGAIGMETDKAKRDQYLALVKLAQYNASTRVFAEADLYREIENIYNGSAAEAEEKKSLIYLNAAIRPETGEGSFQLKQMADSFLNQKPETWRKEYGLEAFTSPEKIRGMNFEELSTRPQKLIEDFEREQKKTFRFNSGFNKDEFLLSTLNAYQKIIENAPEDVKNREDFKKFEQSLQKMHELTGNEKTKNLLKAGAALASRSITVPDTLHTGKSWTLFKGDSDEYAAMKSSLAKVQTTLKEIQTPKAAGLKETDFSQELAEAKEKAFTYMRLKMKNGTKTSFGHEHGGTRLSEGTYTYNRLCMLQDELGLRTSAQRLYDDARFELLENRHDKEWLAKNGVDTYAKMVYAKKFIDAKIPEKTLAPHFAPEKVAQAVQDMKTNYKSMQHLQERYSPDEIATMALKENGLFQKMTKTWSGSLEKEYKKVMEPAEYAKAKKNFEKGYSYDLAAKKLGIKTSHRSYTHHNPVIQEEAEKIRKSPEFKEIISILEKGKTAAELKKQKGDYIGKVKIAPGYEDAKAKLDYEKKCARVTVETMLGKVCPGKKASEEEIQMQIEHLRKNQAFQDKIQQNIADLDKEGVDALSNMMDNPQMRVQMGNEFYQAVNPQPAPNEPQPEIVQPNVQAGQEGPIKQDGPVVQA
ncbi:MAG: hypothetical protein J6P72_05605 [Firmicutes bacterium]|nr:hypothetical protein [Bacillota bacterium]